MYYSNNNPSIPNQQPTANQEQFPQATPQVFSAPAQQVSIPAQQQFAQPVMQQQIPAYQPQPVAVQEPKLFMSIYRAVCTKEEVVDKKTGEVLYHAWKRDPKTNNVVKEQVTIDQVQDGDQVYINGLQKLAFENPALCLQKMNELQARLPQNMVLTPNKNPMLMQTLSQMSGRTIKFTFDKQGKGTGLFWIKDLTQARHKSTGRKVNPNTVII